MYSVTSVTCQQSKRNETLFPVPIILLNNTAHVFPSKQESHRGIV